MDSSRKKRRINWFRLIVVILLVYTVYLGVSQQRQVNAIHLETETARKHMEQLQLERANLQEECSQLKDPKYVEKVAREELGMAKPGEVPYISADKN